MEEKRYEIQWTRTAQRALNRMDRQTQRLVTDAVAKLVVDPRPPQAGRLSGPLAGQWRLRVGIHWRVTYTIDDKVLVVTIENTGSRESIY